MGREATVRQRSACSCGATGPVLSRMKWRHLHSAAFTIVAGRFAVRIITLTYLLRTWADLSSVRSECQEAACLNLHHEQNEMCTPG